MKHRIGVLCFTFFLLSLSSGLSTTAMAATLTARTSEDIALRVAPDWRYERVGIIPKGRKVELIRCLRDYSWCEVRWRSLQGWASALRLRDSRDRFTDEPLPFYGPKLGLRTYDYYPSGHDPHIDYYDDRQGQTHGRLPGPGEVCFYEDDQYRGATACTSLTKRVVNLTPRWNDLISSMRLGPNTAIEACEHANMGGRCWRFRGNVPNVGTANDQISSFAPLNLNRPPY